MATITFIYFICLIFICAIPQSVFGVCRAYHYNSEDCGTTEEIPGDVRTQVPWVAGIFHQPDPFTNFTFISSATVISPTAVLSVFTGPLDKLPRKIRGKHLGQSPDKILIVAGLKSGKIHDSDKYTQYAEVSFIEPYLGTEESNRDFHFVLFHVKTPFDFSTPFVRPICLSSFKLGRKSPASSTSDGTSSSAPALPTFLHGGFASRKVSNNKDGHEKGVVDWEVELKIQVVLAGTGYECVKNYEKYYDKHFPGGMFCSSVPESLPNRTSPGDHHHHHPHYFSCMIQGSSISQKVGHQWYLSGVTSLIRGRKGGLCRSDAIYFNARLSTAFEWIQRSLRCSPFSFSCTDGACIPLESACNSIRNCLDNGLDEHETLCEVNRHCVSSSSRGTPGKSHQCALVGRCISSTQVCDGVRDCDEGSDESPSLCNKENNVLRTSRDLSPNFIQYCLPLHESEGVQIEYISVNHNGLANCTFIPVNTFALLKCKNYYKSRSLVPHLEQQCNDNGKWSGGISSQFQCEPDCGMANTKVSGVSLEGSTGPSVSFPWHALLFDLDKSTQSLQFLCGGTLISSSFLVTAGHCFSAHEGSLKSIKVVLAPANKANFSDNLAHDHSEILDVETVWRPEDFDTSTRVSDLALVKLKRRVHFSANIRPVCFLTEFDDEEDNEADSSNSVGGPFPPPSTSASSAAWKRKTSSTVALGGLHVSDFPQIVQMACILKDFVQLHGDFKCVGHRQGLPVQMADYGGGLVSLVKTKFGSRYVLKGVMSKEESFNTEHISQFTSLERYRNWILQTISR